MAGHLVVFRQTIVFMVAICCMPRVFVYSKPDDVLVNRASKPRTTFYIEKNGHRMARVVESESQSDMLECYLYGDKSIYKKSLEEIPREQIREVGRDTMTKIVNKCMKVHDKNRRIQLKSRAHPSKGFFSDLLIYPGTKWCGPGNVADNDTDLGPSVEADKCCRHHDSCNDTIPPFGIKHGLWNIALFTKSNCECDDKLYKCLYAANTSIANKVARLYFNPPLTSCFKFEHPVIRCLAHFGFKCQKYEFDTSKPREWQYFEAQHYDKKD